MHISPIASTQLNVIMTLATGSCWRFRLALGEWRHWLEGSAQPFLVWTDHKNLEYIRSAKRLSSRQARWHSSLIVSTSPFRTGPGPKMLSPIHFPASSSAQEKRPRLMPYSRKE